ncbi:hypothetical protein TNCT_454031 [Trichonephila clavata]|uniref:Uncharacterized protein n=1 Tax=Trichonephila clavata TaxID=2740835 RepID=A0A8X6F0C7_TRICU|nr:hypothetical protein TNCT_454031 [Trichonephila clavata]
MKTELYNTPLCPDLLWREEKGCWKLHDRNGTLVVTPRICRTVNRTVPLINTDGPSPLPNRCQWTAVTVVTIPITPSAVKGCSQFTTDTLG